MKKRKREAVEKKAVEEKKLTGTFCSECKLPQWISPGGVTCDNGHGGAEPAKVNPNRHAHVQAYELEEATELHTIAKDSSFWERAASLKEWKSSKPTFVRLQPPADFSEEMLTTIEALMTKAGAIVVVQRAKAPIVVLQPVKKPEGSISVRQTVLEVVEQTNTKDRDKLRSRVEETMAEVGL